MENKKEFPQTIDEYIAAFPENIQEKLNQLRQVIQAASPEAQETINYAMPTFKLHGNLVHFAAYKNHIGFYPTPTGIEHFSERLAVYKGAKGSVQFPHDQPMPFDLIREIVLYRVEEITKAAKSKQKKDSAK
jgi:uncharacterized protein YdhG (YjbR/CyaY superfamily)